MSIEIMFTQKLHQIKIFRKDRKYGLMDYHNNIICEPKYESIEYNSDNDYYEVVYNHKIGIVNNFGEEIIPVIYNNIYHIKDCIYFVKKDSCYGVNINSKNIIPAIYTDLSLISDYKYILCGFKKKWGVYDFNGNLLIAPKYSLKNLKKNIKIIIRKEKIKNIL